MAGEDKKEPETSEALLSERTIARLQLFARRAGLKDWSINDIVSALANSAILQDEHKDDPALTDAEMMRRGLESCPGNPAHDGLSDEELLEVTGRELREYETRRLQRPKAEGSPTTPLERIKQGKVPKGPQSPDRK